MATRTQISIRSGSPETEDGAHAEAQLHGSLVEVHGLGVLILGPSGVGKSECLIELVRRGQRMVADDVVRLRRSSDGERLTGRSPESIRHYIELRGLGLLSVADLFGEDAVRDECAIDFVCRLEVWREGRVYERIGLERPREAFLGVSLPTVTLPVQPAGNLATLVDLAVRDWKRRREGVNAAQRLDEQLRERGGILASTGSSEGEGV